MTSLVRAVVRRPLLAHARGYVYMNPFTGCTLSPFGFGNSGPVRKRMEFSNHQVVPDVLDTPPGAIANVQFPGAAAEQGNVLTPTLVKNAPTVTWTDEPNTLYTVVMTDPDAPSREEPTYREWLHWVVVNVPGSGRVAEGQSHFGYVGAGPPPDTGLHRYVVLVYKQGDRIEPSETPRPSTQQSDRPKSNVRAFASKYGLKLVAGNFFQAEFDSYVPELYKTFTDM